MAAATPSVTITQGNAQAELPLLLPTIGPPLLDLRELYRQTGNFAYDPALGEIGVCRTAITYVDGDKGVLLYRGYPIAALVEHCRYLETCWLLLEGELPDMAQLDRFAADLAALAELPAELLAICAGFARDAHPMAMICAMVAGLAGHGQDDFNLFDPEERRRAIYRLIALMPGIAAAAYRHGRGEPVAPAPGGLDYAERFLHLLFAPPGGGYQAPEAAVRALDALLVIQADHEQNASTSAMRLVGSTRANPYACAAAAIAALWGPLHGGANEAVLRTLEAIGSVDRIPEMLARAKDKNDPFRLMGFGHRVYKSYDPRARVLRPLCHKVLGALGRDADPLLQLAMELERMALADDYFVSRRLYPNVDFYSGLIFRALGLPPAMFTPVFAVARSVGWLAHWAEMVVDPETRIVRPRQLYQGPVERPFVPREQRRAPLPTGH
ncbi:MAG TPA: citrate synthase [Stellaceae bacterium]|nr:citrate synthase [Stellaceae bacterium]